MKILVIISTLLIFLSCKNKESKAIEKPDNSKEIELPISDNNTKSDSTNFKDYQNEVMLEEDILFNGKLKRYSTVGEFEKVFEKADSIKLITEEEERCTYIFENQDGSKDINDKYFYKNGSRFENSKDKIAVDEFKFTKSSFIIFKGIKLNSSTSIIELQKLFPNATKDIKDINIHGDGNLKVFHLREDENNVSDGQINIFIKNGKLYLIKWWFPC